SGLYRHRSERGQDLRRSRLTAGRRVRPEQRPAPLMATDQTASCLTFVRVRKMVGIAMLSKCRILCILNSITAFPKFDNFFDKGVFDKNRPQERWRKSKHCK